MEWVLADNDGVEVAGDACGLVEFDSLRVCYFDILSKGCIKLIDKSSIILTLIAFLVWNNFLILLCSHCETPCGFQVRLVKTWEHFVAGSRLKLRGQILLSLVFIDVKASICSTVVTCYEQDSDYILVAQILNRQHYLVIIELYFVNPRPINHQVSHFLSPKI